VRRLREAAVSGRSEGADSVNLAVEESGLLLRIVRDLRRVHSHLASIAYPVLRRTGHRRARATDLLRDEPERLE
jgi:phosphate:Na+ symporter